MADGKYVGRKSIRVPAAGTGEVHVPERVGPMQGMWVTQAELYAPLAINPNTSTIYLGWEGISAVKGNEYAIELGPGAVATLCSPKQGEDGNPEPFDLYDLWITGVTDGDAVMYFTW